MYGEYINTLDILKKKRKKKETTHTKSKQPLEICFFTISSQYGKLEKLQQNHETWGLH